MDPNYGTIPIRLERVGERTTCTGAFKLFGLLGIGTFLIVLAIIIGVATSDASTLAGLYFAIAIGIVGVLLICSLPCMCETRCIQDDSIIFYDHSTWRNSGNCCDCV